MKRNLKEYFKTKYTEDEIKNHYEIVKIRNKKNKERYEEIEKEYSQELKKAREYFKKVKPSLALDWFWCENNYWRLFIYFYDLEESILFYNS